MIKDSCKLIGGEPIFVSNLKLYVIHEQKTSLFSQNSFDLFHSELFLMWPCFSKTIQTHPGQVWPSLGMPGDIQPKIEVLDVTFPL